MKYKELRPKARVFYVLYLHWLSLPKFKVNFRDNMLNALHFTSWFLAAFISSDKKIPFLGASAGGPLDGRRME
jgi:hypothetical protein